MALALSDLEEQSHCLQVGGRVLVPTALPF